MAVNIQRYKEISQDLAAQKVSLVAVSKIKSVSDILELYNEGQRDFGENYVQELIEKHGLLPKDIRWHFIGHLQTNKVKYIAPFIHLIHGVDSEKLVKEINKQSIKNNRTINCLLQVYIAQEETKFGFDQDELDDFFKNKIGQYSQTNFLGLMGMASFSEDMNQVKNEFQKLKNIFDQYALSASLPQPLSILSMGMSADYKIAIAAGSNMVRIGSLLFGARN
ncbi:MAG: YggS family pyridoxal phosphate-dependent enzyme [Ginsengibacter sp.]